MHQVSELIEWFSQHIDFLFFQISISSLYVGTP